MKQMILFSLLFLLISCQKEPLPPAPPPPPISGKLKVQWQTPVTPDTSRHTSRPECIIGENIVFSSNFILPSATVQSLNAETGKEQWRYNGFDSPIDGFVNFQVSGIHDKVIVNNWSYTYALDANTGSRFWSSIISGNSIGGGSQGRLIGEYLYKANFYGPKPKSQSESVVRTHYLSGNWDTLLTITAPDSFYLNIGLPVLWINPVGDSILILRDGMLRDVLATPYEGRYNLVNIYAWNMTQKKFEWILNDFQDEPFVGSLPIVDNNKLYLITFKDLYCLDLANGNVLWKQSFPTQIGNSGMVLHKDFVIVQSAFDGMWAIDKNTGLIRWFNRDTYGSTFWLSYFDGVVYFTSTGSSRLWAVNAENGQTIWDEVSPNAYSNRTPDAGFAFSDVVIDPDRRVLYIADRYYMMCIALPEL
jgi:outer membrane protein assembly factor BamB